MLLIEVEFQGDRDKGRNESLYVWYDQRLSKLWIKLHSYPLKLHNVFITYERIVNKHTAAAYSPSSNQYSNCTINAACHAHF